MTRMLSVLSAFVLLASALVLVLTWGWGLPLLRAVAGLSVGAVLILGLVYAEALVVHEVFRTDQRTNRTAAVLACLMAVVLLVLGVRGFVQPEVWERPAAAAGVR